MGFDQMDQAHPWKRKVEMSNQNRVSEVRTSQNEPEREQRIFTFKATQLIWLFLGILEVLIALRIGLKLIAANPPTSSPTNTPRILLLWYVSS